MVFLLEAARRGMSDQREMEQDRNTMFGTTPLPSRENMVSLMEAGRGSGPVVV
jgi:hypothetical protein